MLNLLAFSPKFLPAQQLEQHQRHNAGPPNVFTGVCIPALVETLITYGWKIDLSAM
jgi:hypothetical protein